MDNIGDLIKNIRKQRGYTQKELADKAGVSRNSIIKYERGEMVPSILALELISNALGVELSAFLPNVESPRNASLSAFCNGFAQYLEAERVDIATCSDTKLMQLFAAFLEQRQK